MHFMALFGYESGADIAGIFTGGSNCEEKRKKGKENKENGEEAGDRTGNEDHAADSSVCSCSLWLYFYSGK